MDFLHDPHVQASLCRDAPLLCLQDQGSPQGIIDQIQKAAKLCEKLRLYGQDIEIRRHSERSRVDDNFRIGTFLISLLTGEGALSPGKAGYVDLRSALIFDSGICGTASFACPQNQDLLSRRISPAVLQQISHGKIRCIISAQPSAPVDDRVHSSDLTGLIADLIQIRNNRLLIGGRHIDPLKTGSMKIFFHLFGPQFMHFIFIIFII